MPIKLLVFYWKLLTMKIWENAAFLQDIRSLKSKIVFLCLKSNLTSVLIPLTKSRP